MRKRSPSPLASSAIANNKQRFKELADKIKKLQIQNNKDNISEIKRILVNPSNSGFQKDRFQQRDFACLRDIATILLSGLLQVTIKNKQLQVSYQHLRNQNDRKQRELFEKQKNQKQLSTQLSRMKSRLYELRSQQIYSLQLEPMIIQENSYSTQNDSKKYNKQIIIQIQNSTQIVKIDKKQSNNFGQSKLKLEQNQNLDNEYNETDDMIGLGKIKQLQSKIENHEQQQYALRDSQIIWEDFGKCQQVLTITSSNQQTNKFDNSFDATKRCHLAKQKYQFQKIYGKEDIYGNTKDSLLIQRKSLKKKQEEVPQLFKVFKNTPLSNKAYAQRDLQFIKEDFGKCQQVHNIQEKNKLDSSFGQTKICSSAKPTQQKGINYMIEIGKIKQLQSKAKNNEQSYKQMEREFPEEIFGKCYNVQSDMPKTNKFDSTIEAAKRCHSAKPKYQFQKTQILEKGKQAIYGKTKDSLLNQRKSLKKKEEEVPQLLIVYKNAPLQNKTESKDLFVLNNQSPLTSNVQHKAQPNQRRSLFNTLDPQLYDISKNSKLVSNLPQKKNRIFNANNKNNNKTLNPISKEPHNKIN